MSMIPPTSPFTNQISFSKTAKFIFACGVFAMCIKTLSMLGYSCTFSHMNAAIGSGNLANYMTLDGVCNQVFGHPCGQTPPVGPNNNPSRNLDAVIAKWETQLRALVTFACN